MIDVDRYKIVGTDRSISVLMLLPYQQVGSLENACPTFSAFMLCYMRTERLISFNGD